MAKELVQNRGSIKFFGQVVGLQNEHTYREDVTKKGQGQPYRSASLSIKTSPTNVVYNQDLFGQVPEKKVKVYSNKNSEKKSLEIDFDDRDKLPEGFTPFGFGTVRTAFEKDEKGKYIQKNYFTYDGVKKIKDTLKDGDSVYINSEFKVESYMKDGEEKSSVKYSVTGIGFLKDAVDFESEKFKEVASFEQEFVVLGTSIDKDTKKLYVQGRIIAFNKTWSDIQFVVDGNEYGVLATNINKKFKFGDVVKVQGIIRNGTVLVQVAASEFDWGGTAPEGQNFNKDRISEIQITQVTEHAPKVYKEDDFIVASKDDPFDTNKSNGASDEFNGVTNPAEDPFS
jgi:hypothetical protein